MIIKDKDIKNWNSLGNELNQISPSERTNERIKQSSKDDIYNNMSNTDWEAESKYHNAYYMGKGRWNQGRTLKMNNKEYLKLNNL